MKFNWNSWPVSAWFYAMRCYHNFQFWLLDDKKTLWLNITELTNGTLWTEVHFCKKVQVSLTHSAKKKTDVLGELVWAVKLFFVDCLRRRDRAGRLSFWNPSHFNTGGEKTTTGKRENECVFPKSVYKHSIGQRMTSWRWVWVNISLPHENLFYSILSTYQHGSKP